MKKYYVHKCLDCGTTTTGYLSDNGNRIYECANCWGVNFERVTVSEDYFSEREAIPKTCLNEIDRIIMNNDQLTVDLF